jgi:protein tyrosine/serine phosphatase
MDAIALDATTRHLEWATCWNVRDLGGLPTAGGGQTRYGALFRADCLGKLTKNGRRALLDAGVTTVIDLRGPLEVADDPPAFPGGRAGEPGYVNTPLDHQDPAAAPLWATIRTRADVYRLFLDFYPHALADVLRAIADAPPGGVVFHCLGGTDRTGLVAAAVLRLAGVPDEAIAADYALTLERRRPIYEQLVAEKGEAGLGFWDRLNMTADQMLATLAYVDERYGGMERYLLAAGLTDEQMARVRARLL